MRKTYLETRRIKPTVKSVRTETFVMSYKGPSQMHVDLINGPNLSSKTYKIMTSISNTMKNDDEAIEMEEQKPKTYKKVKK